MDRSQKVAQGRSDDGQPLLALAQRRVGLRRAFKVLAFMVAWDHVRDDLGREPTIREYASWWRESEATAYRHQQLFRQAFPGHDTPSALLDLAAEQANVRRGAASLGATIVPS